MAVKVIQRGKIENAPSVAVQSVSEGAKAAIQKAGGSVTLTKKPMKEALKAKKRQIISFRFLLLTCLNRV